jgi:hypothetical protein
MNDQPKRGAPSFAVARRKTLIALTVLLLYRLALPPTATSTLLSQVLSPAGSSFPALATVFLATVIRMWLVIVLPVSLIRWWLPLIIQVAWGWTGYSRTR